MDDGEQPHCSRDHGTSHLEKQVKEAEKAKGKIYEVTGNTPNIDKGFFQAVVIDDGYLTLGTHIDESTKQKVENGKYID